MSKKNVTALISQELADLLDRPMTERRGGAKKKEHYNPEADPEFVASFLKLEFVEELRNAMLSQNISASELARRTGISRQAVSQALDRDDPDNFTIEKMAELVTAVGVRISIKVHEAGTTVVTKPVHDEVKATETTEIWNPPVTRKTESLIKRDTSVYLDSKEQIIIATEAEDEQSAAA